MNPDFQSHFVYPEGVFLPELLSGFESSFLGLDLFAFNAYKEFGVYKVYCSSLHHSTDARFIIFKPWFFVT